MSYKDALSIVRNLEQFDTGNLRWNATYAINMGNGEYDIIIDSKIAPYIVYLDREIYEETIPNALAQFVASTVQQRRESGLASKQAIINTAQTSNDRETLFNKMVGVD